MGGRRIRVLRERFTGRPAFDTAVTRALLQGVAAGEQPESLRLYGPDAVLAFGPKDVHAPGLSTALRAARAQGFEPVLRLAGGRAAVFHEATLAFAWAIPDPDARAHVHAHFEALAELVVEAFRALGVDARVGAVPGEYCPGDHSVNARGATKLMGVGQRVIRGATHVGGVVVVDGAQRIRDVLEPVYGALELDWRPEATGSLADELGPLSLERATGALLDAFAARHELVDGELSAQTLAAAEALEPEHVL